MKLSLKLLLSHTLLSSTVVALHAPLYRRSYPKFTRRSDVFGMSSLNNSMNTGYFMNVTLGGVHYSVLIDTGRFVHRYK